jgi:predicted nucleotidyltransferase
VNDVIRQLAQAKVRFIIIGGHAIRYAGFPRFTQDWDLYIPPRDAENFAKINCAMEEERDIEVLPLGPNGENFIQTFQTQWAVLQFHLIVAGIPSFEEAEAEAVEVTDGGVKVKRLSGRHLLAAKEKAGRPSDQQDIFFLRELQRQGKLI